MSCSVDGKVVTIEDFDLQVVPLAVLYVDGQWELVLHHEVPRL